ncbi:hypothetical protein SS1G_08812 [Sclerotinia sclerotiorum 1980 UF-70]|uniref:Uncharacterized protein n=1 Tax=Sclerotinia sclerotiorum (strain ATCC 18683 / 1980 / Ss-1) TaxID=665079 RepID=A7EU05_SCLS1|nr:hypothetical protein SS1G_08812 [Sclerotinia sclerotiorum 1980 UF-70]EDN92947.1 hypothetical protein SS1G_08812 [Sclerotinia sclerotiorum 1980 UF-70]
MIRIVGAQKVIVVHRGALPSMVNWLFIMQIENLFVTFRDERCNVSAARFLQRLANSLRKSWTGNLEFIMRPRVREMCIKLRVNERDFPIRI